MELLLAGIAPHEAEVFGSPATGARFLGKGHWMVREGALAGMIGRRLAGGGQIPGLTLGRLLAMASMRLAPGEGRHLASRADAILLNRWGTRLRTFHLGGGRPAAIKLVVKGTPKAERTATEIDARRTIEELGTIPLPRLVGVDETADLIRIVEELVLGRRFSGRRDLAPFIATVLPAFAATWAAYGRRLSPAGALVGEAAVATVRQTLAAQPANGWFLARLERALARNPMLGVSICHGDLLPSNLCVTSRGITVFDWERAREWVAVFDLMKLACKLPAAPALMKAVALATAEAFGTPAASFGDQAVCYLALRIAERPAMGLAILQRFRRQVEEDRWW
jgi:hypothetical protein